MDSQTETRPGTRRPLVVRGIALFLAIVLIAEVGLFNASTIRFLRESFEDSDYETVADYIAEDDDYLSMSRLERMRAVLRAMGQLNTYDDYSLAASIAIADEDYDKAAEYLSSGIELFRGSDAELAELYVKLGCVNGLRNEWKYAELNFLRATELDDTSATGWLMLSEAQLRQNDYEHALENISRYGALEELNADQFLAVGSMQFQLGRYEECVESCEKAMSYDDCDMAGALLTRARARLMLGQTAETVADAQACLAIEPNNAEAVSLLAMCSDTLGDYEQALSYYRQLIDLGFAGLDSYEQAVQSAYLMEDYPLVVSLSQEALAKADDREAIPFYKWLGVAQVELAEYAEGEKNLTAFIEADEAGPEIYYLRGICRLATENYKAAAEDFTSAMEEETLIDESLYNRALCWLNLNEAEKGAADFQEILERNANPQIVALTLELLELSEEDLDAMFD